MVWRANRLMRVLSTLSKDFPGHMYLAGYLPGVATPVIAGDKAKLKRGSMLSNLRHVSSLRGPKV